MQCFTEEDYQRRNRKVLSPLCNNASPASPRGSDELFSFLSFSKLYIISIQLMVLFFRTRKLKVA